MLKFFLKIPTRSFTRYVIDPVLCCVRLARLPSSIFPSTEQVLNGDRARVPSQPHLTPKQKQRNGYRDASPKPRLLLSLLLLFSLLLP